jgi:hypothetical protein
LSPNPNIAFEERKNKYVFTLCKCQKVPQEDNEQAL